jgi:hypothetical protein
MKNVFPVLLVLISVSAKSQVAYDTRVFGGEGTFQDTIKIKAELPYEYGTQREFVDGRWVSKPIILNDYLLSVF